MGREAPTFGRQAQHVAYPHGGGGGGTQEAPTHSQTDQHKRKYPGKHFGNITLPLNTNLPSPPTLALPASPPTAPLRVAGKRRHERQR